jgi:hypothetical protein
MQAHLAYLELHLKESLSKKFGQAVCDYLLASTWSIEERCKGLLEFAIGHRLSERADVFQPWKSNVQEIRNDLSHGTFVHLDTAAVEMAHQAVFQAIRWVQSVS